MNWVFDSQTHFFAFLDNCTHRHYHQLARPGEDWAPVPSMGNAASCLEGQQTISERLATHFAEGLPGFKLLRPLSLGVSACCAHQTFTTESTKDLRLLPAMKAADQAHHHRGSHYNVGGRLECIFSPGSFFLLFFLLLLSEDIIVFSLQQLKILLLLLLFKQTLRLLLLWRRRRHF